MQGQPSEAAPAALQGRPQAVLVYPDLHTVPARPQLSYPVEQRREIVERLISDRELARYTSQRIRYEAGVSSLPPPPEPPHAALQEAAGAQAARIMASPAQLPAPGPGPMLQDQEPGLLDGDYRSLDENDPQVDDGTLSDFMRDFVRNTGPGPAPEAGPEVPTGARDADAQAAPGGGKPGSDAESGSGGLMGWFGSLFRSEAAAPEAAPGDTTGEDAGETATPDLIGSPPQPAMKPRLAVLGGAPAGADGAPEVITFAPGSYALPDDSAAVLERAAADMTDAGGGIEVRATATDRALAIDRARAVALVLMEAGVGLDQIEIVVEEGPDEARLVLAGRPS